MLDWKLSGTLENAVAIVFPLPRPCETCSLKSSVFPRRSNTHRRGMVEGREKSITVRVVGCATSPRVMAASAARKAIENTVGSTSPSEAPSQAAAVNTEAAFDTIALATSTADAATAEVTSGVPGVASVALLLSATLGTAKAARASEHTATRVANEFGCFM